MSIHPLAVVSPHAELGRDVRIGPFCVVEPGVVLGDGCHLVGRVTVKSGLQAGELVVTEGVYALKARALKSQIGSGHGH